MARFRLAKTNMLLLREFKQHERCVNNLIRVVRTEELADSTDDEKRVNLSCWVPHPRTGIYYPKGHEWVMDSVPDDAASFNHTYWLRSVEGVEKLSPDSSPDHHPAHNTL